MKAPIFAGIWLLSAALVPAISIAATQVLWGDSVTMNNERADFTLIRNTKIEKNKLVADARLRFSQMAESTVLLTWFQSENMNLAYEIRSRLVDAGIDSALIVMEQKIGGSNSLLNLSIGTDTTVFHTCNYHLQDYKYRQKDKVGCALENLRRASTVKKSR